MGVVTHLDAWDYGVCGVVLLLTSLLGLYHSIKARKAKDERTFLVSDSEIGYIPLIMSLIATYVSAIGILGFPSDAYTYGIICTTMAYSSLLIIPFGLFIFLPVYCDIRGGTLFEYLERRFNRTFRLICSVALNIKTVLYSSIAIYAPSLALNQATGLHTWLSVALIGVVCIIYTSLGGIKAVIWADATQLCVMVLILIMVTVKGTIDLGGISEIVRINTEGERLDATRDDLLYTWWLMLLAYPLHQLGSTFGNQSMVQRYISKPTYRQNVISFLGGTIGVSFVQFFMASAGFLLYARYFGCDPLLNKDVTSRDQMLVLFAIETLSFCRGLPGLFIAGILCASLSTLSSTLNSMATVTIEDYIRPFKPHVQPKTLIKLSKLIAVVYGIICIGFVFVVQNLGGVMQVVFCVTGMIQGPLVAVLLIGMLIPWVDSGGISAGFIASLVVSSWAAIGSMVNKVQFNHLPYSTAACELNSTDINQRLFNITTDDQSNSHSILNFNVDHKTVSEPFLLYSVSSIWYTLWSLAIVFVVSQLYYFLFGSSKNVEDMDPRVIAKCARQLLGKLSPALKKKLGFTNKVDHRLWFGENEKELEDLTVKEASNKTNGFYHPVTTIHDDAGDNTITL